MFSYAADMMKRKLGDKRGQESKGDSRKVLHLPSNQPFLTLQISKQNKTEIKKHKDLSLQK